MKHLLFPILFLLAACTNVPLSSEEKSQVLVVSTLHQLHEEVTYYTYEDLASIVTSYKPDIVMVELTQEGLDARQPQKTKREYSEAIYPLLDNSDMQALPLEPSEPLFSELVGQFRAAIQDGHTARPSETEAFQVYNSALLDMLLVTWTSPADVNSSLTDKLFEAKHAAQDQVFGAAHAKAWEAWNQHFLSQVQHAAERPGASRIIVLVGAEHGYWMRHALAKDPHLAMLNTESFLLSQETSD